ASEEHIADQRARVFRTHPAPYSIGSGPSGDTFQKKTSLSPTKSLPSEQVPKDFVQPLVNRGLTCVQASSERKLAHPEVDASRRDYSSKIKRPPQDANQLGEYVPVYEYLNTTRDFLSTMGYNRPERISPPARIDWRSVYIDNGSDIPVNIGINADPFNPPDNVLFRLQPEEGRWVLINAYGGSPQYLWPFFTDAQSCGSRDSNGKCLSCGPPRILSRNANSFVLKSGVVGVYIITFQYPTFTAS